MKGKNFQGLFNANITVPENKSTHININREQPIDNDTPMTNDISFNKSHEVNSFLNANSNIKLINFAGNDEMQLIGDSQDTEQQPCAFGIGPEEESSPTSKRDLIKIKVLIIPPEGNEMGIDDIYVTTLLDEGSTFSIIKEETAAMLKLEPIRVLAKKKAAINLKTFAGTIDTRQRLWVKVQIGRGKLPKKDIPAMTWLKSKHFPTDCELVLSRFDYETTLRMDRKLIGEMMEKGRRNFRAPFIQPPPPPDFKSMKPPTSSSMEHTPFTVSLAEFIGMGEPVCYLSESQARILCQRKEVKGEPLFATQGDLPFDELIKLVDISPRIPEKLKNEILIPGLRNSGVLSMLPGTFKEPIEMSKVPLKKDFQPCRAAHRRRGPYSTKLLREWGESVLRAKKWEFASDNCLWVSEPHVEKKLDDEKVIKDARVTGDFVSVNNQIDIIAQTSPDVRETRRYLIGRRWYWISDLASAFGCVTLHPDSWQGYLCLENSKGYYSPYRKPGRW